MNKGEYRAWHPGWDEMVYSTSGTFSKRSFAPMEFEVGFSHYPQDDLWVVMQSIGLDDAKGCRYYIGDIGQFSNGDKFVLKKEDWLEVYPLWIGDAKCEDQTRELYRINKATIIGNEIQNPELLGARDEL